MRNIGNITNTRYILDKYNLQAKKKFGQNFLIDSNIIDKIACDDIIDKQTFVVEIGGGIGSLTEKLVEKAGFVLTYDIDCDMIKIISDNLKVPNLALINCDILKADVISDIKKYNQNQLTKFVVVSNLPYYITSDIIEQFLSKYSCFSHYIFMMQKEVSLRLLNNTHDKNYTILNVLIDLVGRSYKLCDVARNLFYPAPNVDSTVIVIEANKVLDIDKKMFHKLVKQAFYQRRKTIYNNFKLIMDVSLLDEMFNALNLDKNLRVEQTDASLYIDMVKYLNQHINQS